MKFQLSLAATLIVGATAVFADGHATPTVEASDQDVSNGVISASTVVAGETGWLVVHKTAVALTISVAASESWNFI
ncbi:MAG: hypothetical protein AAFV96_06570 [Pseudomonadota bacterium]